MCKQLIYAKEGSYNRLVHAGSCLLLLLLKLMTGKLNFKSFSNRSVQGQYPQPFILKVKNDTMLPYKTLLCHLLKILNCKNDRLYLKSIQTCHFSISAPFINFPNFYFNSIILHIQYVSIRFFSIFMTQILKKAFIVSFPAEYRKEK